MTEPANRPDLTLAIVAGVFDARPGAEAALGAVLAHYVVVSRTSPGCRNIDLVASLTTPGRFLIYEKWESADAPARPSDVGRDRRDGERPPCPSWPAHPSSGCSRQ